MTQITTPSVPTAVLNHHVFQWALSVNPVDPVALYKGLLSEAGGSLARLQQQLDEYPARQAAIPVFGQGIGPQRNITLEHGVSLVLTYITITSYPHYAVEMTVQPSDHTVLDGSGTIHGFPIPDEPLHAYDGVYLMAIDQGFRVRVRAGTTRYFTVPEQPH